MPGQLISTLDRLPLPMKNVLLVLIFGLVGFSCKTKKEETAKPEPITIGDITRSEICRASLNGLSKGDIDSFVGSMADNAVYVFNNGDSLVGKEAITNYWRDRRENLIDKLTFSSDVFLVVKCERGAFEPYHDGPVGDGLVPGQSHLQNREVDAAMDTHRLSP